MNLLNEELIYEIKLSANYKAFTVFYNGDINFLKILTAAKSKKKQQKNHKKKKKRPRIIKTFYFKTAKPPTLYPEHNLSSWRPNCAGASSTSPRVLKVTCFITTKM